ncbi:MAG: hypothetical protein HQ498_10135 [Pseudohongiella sp.]|nr:hypothetical protein [Pseudohongiella sp.]
MTIEEFTKIVESYGSEAARWPAEQREQCRTFMASNAAASTLLNQQRELESLLDQITVPEFPTLESRVLNQQLPKQEASVLDRALAWLLPKNSFSQQLWRPAMLACLPLVFGIVIGNFFSFGIALENDGFAYWDDELTMLSLNEYTENSF